MKKKFQTEGALTGRLTHLDPDDWVLGRDSTLRRFAMARTKPFPGKGGKTVAESTPGAVALNADFSEIEKRVLAHMGEPRNKSGEQET